MTWTLFWQVFILLNLGGFWAAVLANTPARRDERWLLGRAASRTRIPDDPRGL